MRPSEFICFSPCTPQTGTDTQTSDNFDLEIYQPVRRRLFFDDDEDEMNAVQPMEVE